MVRSVVRVDNNNNNQAEWIPHLENEIPDSNK
jgi:hypothetical protein